MIQVKRPQERQASSNDVEAAVRVQQPEPTFLRDALSEAEVVAGVIPRAVRGGARWFAGRGRLSAVGWRAGSTNTAHETAVLRYSARGIPGPDLNPPRRIR